jgi:MraZ protein
VEIWSKAVWDESVENYDDNMDDIAENMESLGFSI